MGIRFRRRAKIAPGLTLNLNRKSVGLTTGVKGAHASINTKGQRTNSIGIPGTGLSYVDTKNAHSKESETEETQESQNSYKNKTNIEIKIEAAKKLKAKYSNKTLKKFSIIFRCLGVLLISMSLLLCLASLFALIFVAFGIFVIYLGGFYSKTAKGYYDDLVQNVLESFAESEAEANDNNN